MNRIKLFLVTFVCCLFSAAFTSAQIIPTFVKTYTPNTGWDSANAIQATADFGYIVAGTTTDTGFGSFDFFLAKLDASGNIQWRKVYGGFEGDEGTAVTQTSDGGYILVGLTVSFGAGKTDFLILKVDSSGNVQWQKTIGGGEQDRPQVVLQASDGGYLIAGTSWLNTTFAAYAWMIKLDSSGNLVWQKSYTQAGNDGFASLEKTPDGGYIASGFLSSSIWVAKLDSSAAIEWQKTYDGPGWDAAGSAKPTSDGGYIVTGGTSSGAGSIDVFVMKLDSNGNPLWKKTYGHANYDYANSIVEVSGGYVLVATKETSTSVYDAWIFKIDNNGTVVWQKTMNLGGQDYATAAASVSDGGIAFVGPGNSQWWLVKTNQNGNIGPTCSFISDTSVVAADLNLTVATLTAAPADTTLTLITSTASTANNSETPSELCSNQGFGPNANDDAFSVIQNSTSNVLNVLANDTDPDNDVLSLTGQVTDPPNGTVVITNNFTTIEYTPDPNFIGTDTFIYSMSDGQDGYDDATVTITVNAPSNCEQEDDFEDGIVDLTKWTILKPFFAESLGSLQAIPTGKKAIAMFNPGTCTNCAVHTTMHTSGGEKGRVWLLAWYQDKKNTIELMMNEKSDKWIFKIKQNGTTIAKAKGVAQILPNTVYYVAIGFDGTKFQIIIDGVELITVPSPILPNGKFGFQTRGTTAQYAYMCIDIF